MTLSLNPVKVYEFIEGHWTRVPGEVYPRAASPRFLICCEYGDWSGFRTLENCLMQVMTPTRPDGFYWIEER